MIQLILNYNYLVNQRNTIMIKKMLLSAFILGTTTNITSAIVEDKILDKGWSNKINNESLILSILSHKCYDKLNDVRVIDKLSDKTLLWNGSTIGSIKSKDNVHIQADLLEIVTSGYSIACGNNAIILRSKDINDCNRLRNEYENFSTYYFLKKNLKKIGM